MDDLSRAEAFRAEIERLKPLIKSGEPFWTEMPEALAQARGEVIHELLNRPSLSSSQIDLVFLLLSARPPELDVTVERADELARTLRALRTDLTTETNDGT